MEIKDMQAFFAVVEEGNISHAAVRLKIAQPALSRQMKRLETTLGVQLFERGNRHISLTEAGKLLYERVSHILGLVDGTVKEISEIGSGVAGSVRIGTITTSGALLLPELIAEFHKQFPQVTFQIWEGEGARVLELLDNRVIEIGITRTQVDNDIYESITLPAEPFILAMSRDFANGRSRTMQLSELKDKPMIIPLRWAETFTEHCEKLGFVPNFVCVSDSIVQDVLCAKMGLGIAVLPLSARSLLTDDSIVYRELTKPEISTQTVVAWLKNRTLSPAGKHFVELFKAMFCKAKEGK